VGQTVKGLLCYWKKKLQHYWAAVFFCLGAKILIYPSDDDGDDYDKY